MSVVVVGADPAFVDGIRPAATELGADLVDTVTMADFIETLRERGEGVETVVLGTNVDDPIQALHRCHSSGSDWPVLVVADAQARAALSRALQFSLFVGSHVEVVAPDVRVVGEKLAAAVTDYRRRRRHRATIAALNAQIQSEAARPPNQPASEYLSRILDSAPVGIIATDTEGTIIAWNRHAVSLFALTERAALGRPLRTILPACADALATKPPAENWQTLVVHDASDGTRRWLQLVVAPLTRHGGSSGRLCIVQDVTEQKVAEHRVLEALEREQRAREEAEAANRAKDQFLFAVSHELRTPLTAVLGWIEILRRVPIGEETRTHAVDVIERNARALAQLIEDLLDIGRIASGKLRFNVGPVDIAAIVELAIESIRPAADAKGIVLSAELSRDAAVVRGDAERLQQVVWNLLSNAVKFTPQHGRVRAALGRRDSQIVLTVEDTGVGIDSQFLPYVFDPFRQADTTLRRSRGGLGLGLTIAKHIVEEHGGAITASSAGAERGSAFTVMLPVAVVGGAATDRRDVPQAGPPGSLDGVSVLVVDDDEDTRELLKMVLSGARARVTTASRAAAAFESLQQARPDVIVCDIGMPDEDGISLIKRIRALPEALGGTTPAVAVTAFASRNDREWAIGAGFDAHLAKPVDAAALIGIVESLSAKGSRRGAVSRGR